MKPKKSHLNISSNVQQTVQSMVGKHKGFIKLLKKEVPNVIAIHCVIHRQHLVSKMIKVSPLNDRFKGCFENNNIKKLRFQDLIKLQVPDRILDPFFQICQKINHNYKKQ